MSSIKLYRGEFGHVSVLNVSSNLVTHAHTEAHIIIWLEGAAGNMVIGGEAVTPGPAAAAAVNSLEPHSHSMASEHESGLFLAFYIDPQWALRRRGLPSGTALFAKPTIPMDLRLYRAVVDIFNLLRDEGNIDDFVDYEIERLIDSLLDVAQAQSVRLRPLHAQSNSLDYRVRKAIDLMKLNICERICFDDLARKVGLSRAHFFSLFKEQTRLTPNVYWNTLRMDEARRQLQCSEDSLISVACNLGFTTQGNFSRFFRDHVGVPPIEYRKAAAARIEWASVFPTER
ncbi:AraC family transcriptional regulator [Hoeflea sp. G2-23]|uniref:AraC family transcriptional regulator n=1 Tax=Hoeflea algicola TaxID=2983763 RepID=A0ABT3ZEL9_9HYPH|nr:AraC family transcriptional regulator [Hoeflea algicola]MCY0150091.1 AraC family transcriptional regulator [Hoeflea algicola]